MSEAAAATFDATWAELGERLPVLVRRFEEAERAFAGCGAPYNPCAAARATRDRAWSDLWEADATWCRDEAARNGVWFSVDGGRLGPFVFSSGDKLTEFLRGWPF